MNTELKYISEAALTDLRTNIRSNLELYRGSGFHHLEDEPSWDIDLKIDYDQALLGTLDLTQQQNIVDIDRKNSLIVGQALSGLTPSLANEELVWVRISHLDAFEYSKARWLSETDEDDALVASIQAHIFAPTQTAIRDDHSVSRLWWNYHIARSCMPDDVEKALGLILKTADIRSNFVERIWMSSRRQIAGAILRAIDEKAEITATEVRFRAFMKIINRYGGGIVFEALSDAEADKFVGECCDRVAEVSEAA
ncbi:MAG: hypothetical protein CMM78_00220 [Rhodospirillaceae bacterium]|jgi:hypothetical protein|uniref:DUF6339 family protein n=1 Tax=Hwanghaeella sp. 1Z406 TaxID=3402811 RepID=UPI000C3CD17B|nr:hypothetical protein [Rhodospirillales bacterium]MAX46615.1 hypothetical protein [Rhodospirillaceae bacterium]|tara:strand:- start:1379 stop:2137 length:759 start_codon:yes stop_codon:yes gene_type:complete